MIKFLYIATLLLRLIYIKVPSTNCLEVLTVGKPNICHNKIDVTYREHKSRSILYTIPSVPHVSCM